MKIILKELSYSGFKGAKEIFEFNEGENVFKGVNGTGKTRIFDAICWLTRGKNSKGDATFSIKTIDNDGEVESRGDHCAIAVYSRNDIGEIELKKLYKEKWSKKRNSLAETMTGHTTTHYVNKWEVSETEYKKAVLDFFTLDFSLVTDPMYFDSLPWAEGRALLRRICPDIDDGPILKEFGLSEILKGDTVDNVYAANTQRQKKITSELSVIPAIIKEDKRIIDEKTGVANLTDTDIEQIVSISETVLSVAIKNLEDFKNSSGRSVIAESLKELNIKLGAKETEFLNRKRNENNQFLSQVSARDFELKEIESLKAQNVKNLKDKDVLLEKYQSIRSRVFDGENCFNCGEPLKGEKKDNAMSEFNESRSKTLSENMEKGLALKSIIESNEVKISKLTESTSMLIIKPAILEEESTPEIEKLKLDISEKRAELEGNEIPESLMTAVTDAKELKKSADLKKADFDSVKSIRAAILGLEANLKTMTTEFNKLEKINSNIDDFRESVARKTEESVNGMFHLVTFRLFEKIIKGGYKNKCEVTINGRGFNDSLSNGERIKAGCDIVEKFSEKLDIYGPIIIDNAESVTGLKFNGRQVIRLVVDEEVEQLKKVI